MLITSAVDWNQVHRYLIPNVGRPEFCRFVLGELDSSVLFFYYLFFCTLKFFLARTIENTRYLDLSYLVLDQDMGTSVGNRIWFLKERFQNYPGTRILKVLGTRLSILSYR